jgi:hypothetical protein
MITTLATKTNLKNKKNKKYWQWGLALNNDEKKKNSGLLRDY